MLKGSRSSQLRAWFMVTDLLLPAEPSRRTGYAMAYDAKESEVIMFGGVNPSSAYSGCTDTWVYSEGTWSNITPSLADSPPPSGDQMMAYDPGDNGVLLFENAAFVGPSNNILLQSQTWLFSDNQWFNLTANQSASPPGDGYDAMSTYGAGGGVLLFGGQNGIGFDSMTWEFELGHWRLLSPAKSPTGRGQLAMSENPSDGGVLLFGGINYTGAVANWLNDTWLFYGGTWTKLQNSSSPPKLVDSLAVDTGTEVVLWGGVENVSSGPPYPLYNGTWGFSNSTWTEVSTKGTYATYVNASSNAYVYSALYDVKDG